MRLFNSQLTRKKRHNLLGFTWYETLVEQIISWSQRDVNKIDTAGSRVKVFSKFNNFPSQKTEKLNFEPLLKVWGTNIAWSNIRKVVFRLKWEFNQVRTRSGSGDMGFCCFYPNLSHNLSRRVQNYPTHQYLFWRQLKPSRGHLRGHWTTIRVLPWRWDTWSL